MNNTTKEKIFTTKKQNNKYNDFAFARYDAQPIEVNSGTRRTVCRLKINSAPVYIETNILLFSMCYFNFHNRISVILLYFLTSN